MKKFIAGFVCAALFFTAPSVVASVEEFVLQRANFPVEIDGEEYRDDELPVLVYKSNTYVPLRNFCDAVGADIAWERNKVAIRTSQADTKQAIRLPNNMESTTHKGYSAILYEDKYYLSLDDLKKKSAIISTPSEEGWNTIVLHKKYELTKTLILDLKEDTSLYIQVECLDDDGHYNLATYLESSFISELLED